MDREEQEKHLKLITECDDRRQYKPGQFWVSEETGSSHKHDRRQCKPLIHVLSDLKDQSAENNFNGMAAVMLRNDGGYDLVVAGEAMNEHIITLGAISRLVQAISAMKGSFDDYF